MRTQVKRNLKKNKSKKLVTNVSKKINIQIKEYNNKTRKGLFISIKSKKLPERLYRYGGLDGEIDASTRFYRDKYIYKRSWTKSRKEYVKQFSRAVNKEKDITDSPISRQADRYMNKIRKLKPIERSINKGIAKVVINKVYKKQPLDIKLYVKKLLSVLVYDKELIDVLSEDQNLEKIKHRFEYSINVKNEKGETSFTMNKFNELPSKAVNQIKSSVTEGEEMRLNGSDSSTARKLKNLNWNMVNSYSGREGKLSDIQMTIIFRK